MCRAKVDELTRGVRKESKCAARAIHPCHVLCVGQRYARSLSRKQQSPKRKANFIIRRSGRVVAAAEEADLGGSDHRGVDPRMVVAVQSWHCW